MKFRDFINESPSCDVMLKNLVQELEKTRYKIKVENDLKSKTVKILGTKYKVSVCGEYAGKYTLFETIGTNVNELKSYGWNNILQLLGAIR